LPRCSETLPGEGGVSRRLVRGEGGSEGKKSEETLAKEKGARKRISQPGQASSGDATKRRSPKRKKYAKK